MLSIDVVSNPVPIKRFFYLILGIFFLSGQALGQLNKHLPEKPSVALVLSGGGARGLAHIGVLQILDSAHIPIDLIVGTSMGAVIGGLYAAGYSPAELEAIARQSNWADILSFDDDSHRLERLPEKKDEKTALLALRFNGFFQPVFPQAVSSGQRLTMFLNSLILSSPYGTRNDFLRDLKVPFIALATDIVSGNRILLTGGDLTAAIRASATLPLRFYPLNRDSSLLVDGGLVNNVPVDVAKDSAGASFVIASNTTAELRTRDELSTPWDVADQVITLMMQRENAIQLSRADIVIEPKLEQKLPDDFENAEFYIEAGRTAARAMLRTIASKITRTAEIAAQKTPADSLLCPVIRSFVFHGVTKNDADSLYALVSSMKGDRLLHSTLDKIRANVLQYLHRNNFSQAYIDSTVIYPPAGEIDMYIDPGYIKEISIVGLHSMKPVVVLDQLPFSKGDIIYNHLCERGLKNLTATGFFSYANVEVIRAPVTANSLIIKETPPPRNFIYERPQGNTIVQVSVEEFANQVVRLGGLADNEFGAQFSLEYEHQNLLGLGGELSLKGGLGQLSRYAAATISGGPPLVNISGSAYSNYKDISQYSFHEDIPNGKYISTVSDVVREFTDIGASLRVGINIDRQMTIFGKYRFERQHSYSLQTFNTITDHLDLSSVKGGFILDNRDDRDYPHSGQFIQGSYEIGLHFLGAQTGYTKALLMGAESVPLSRLHSISITAAIGVADKTVPRQEQFTLGGIHSFFGLNEYELRGKQFASGSLGYQIAIPNTLLFPTFVRFRYDLGAMWSEPEAIKFQSFIHGLGAEIGFKTPIGPASFGLGENFRFAQNDKKPLLLNRPRFYFSIGQNL